MRIILDPLFIFIFVFSLLFLKIINVDNDNYIGHKVMIFTAILIFDFGLQIIKRIRSNCIIKANKVMDDSLKVAIIGTLGYSIFQDLLMMERTKESFAYLKDCHNNKSAVISGIIALVILIIKIFEMVFQSKDALSCY